MPGTFEPVYPAQATEMYLDARKHEVSRSALDGYHYRSKHFVRRCEQVEGIDNVNDLELPRTEISPSGVESEPSALASQSRP